MSTIAKRLVPAAAAAAVGLWTFDESLGLRQWKRVAHTVNSPTLSSPMKLQLDAITRPPPIGCIDWPAGRVLLQWAIDNLPEGSTTLEIGAGIGTTAIGLALAGRKVFATDIDEDALDLLRENADLNGLMSLSVSRWDATGGAPAVASLPVKASTLTHVIGSDLVY